MKIIGLCTCVIKRATLLEINYSFDHDTLKCNLFVKKCPKYKECHNAAQCDWGL